MQGGLAAETAVSPFNDHLMHSDEVSHRASVAAGRSMAGVRNGGHQLNLKVFQTCGVRIKWRLEILQAPPVVFIDHGDEI